MNHVLNTLIKHEKNRTSTNLKSMSFSLSVLIIIQSHIILLQFLLALEKFSSANEKANS